MKDYGPPTPLRLPRKLDDQIAHAAEMLGMSKQDTMRLAMSIGLEDLKRLDYNLAKALVSAAREQDNKITELPLDYSKKKNKGA